LERHEPQPHRQDGRRHRCQQGIELATVQTLIDEGARVAGAARKTVVLEAATREWLLGR
jgi:hypothetical protein